MTPPRDLNEVMLGMMADFNLKRSVEETELLDERSEQPSELQ